MDLSDLREALQAEGLERADLDPDPLVQFGRWYDEAGAAGLFEPEAVILTTVGAQGRPSSRYVLLKGVDSGFVFYTNYLSRKGRDLDENPVAALCFPWNAMSRQVRVSGPVEKVSESESDTYFDSRERGSKIGAWVSLQSEVLDDRHVLEARVAEMQERFAGEEVPRPVHWGGFRIVPDEIEFWQARPNRLHDRFVYVRSEGGGWVIQRLFP